MTMNSKEQKKLDRAEAKEAKKAERQAAKAERKEAKAAEKAKVGKQVAWLNASPAILTLYENGYVQRQEGFKKETHSLEGVTVELDEGSALESRFTATRFFALGIFALAFKKKKGGEQFLVLLHDDFQWVEEVSRKQVKDATAFFHKVRAKQREMGW